MRWRRLLLWLGLRPKATTEPWDPYDIGDPAEETPYLIAWTRSGGAVWSDDRR